MRAASASFVMLIFIAGCSDSSSKPPRKSGTVLPGTKDKDGGTAEPAPTKSDDKAVHLLEEAIKLHGGMDALGKLASIERSVKGTHAVERREVEFNADSL